VTLASYVNGKLVSQRWEVKLCQGAAGAAPKSRNRETSGWECGQPEWTQRHLATALGRVEAYVPIQARPRAIEATKRLGIHRQRRYSRKQKYRVDPAGCLESGRLMS
jgi:hypothetical protein